MIVRTMLMGTACVLAMPAAAQTGSRGTPLAVALTVTPPAATAGVTVGPLAVSEGRGPASYARDAAVATVGAGATLSSQVTLGAFGIELSRLTTAFRLDGRALSSTASGGAAGASASASIADVGAGITQSLSLLGGPVAVESLFGLSAGLIQSTASVDAATGLFRGTSTITDLRLGGGLLAGLPGIGAGLGQGAGVTLNPAANSVLLDTLGLRIVLNEQLTSGGLFTTNAVSLTFRDFAAGTGLVNGTIVLGQSQVERIGVLPAAVPEPATWAMMIGGFGLVGAAMRRRRGTAVLA